MLALVFVTLVAVEPSDVARALAVAEDLERARSFAAAVLQVEAVQKVAPPEQQRDLAMRRCGLMRQAGALDDARICYHALAPLVELAALYEIEILAQLGASIADQERRLLEFIERSPASEAARRALVALTVVAQQGMGEDAALAQVIARAAPQGALDEAPKETRELLAEALVYRGRLWLSKDPSRALEHVEHASLVARTTVWLDDAEFLRMEVLRALGRLRAALEVCDAIIDARRSSFFVGSYDSQYLDDAYLARVEIFVALGELERAREALAKMRKDVPTSRLLDDGARALARGSAR